MLYTLNLIVHVDFLLLLNHSTSGHVSIILADRVHPGQVASLTLKDRQPFTPIGSLE